MNYFKQQFQYVLITLIAIFLLCFTYGCKGGKKYVTISFDANGGTAVSEMKVEKNTAIGELPTTSKENYEFVGWFTSINEGTQITNDYIVKNDMTLYAHFNGIEEYCTITYNTNGGTEVKESRVKKGSQLGNLPFTDKVGYSFLGWFTSNDGVSQIYEDDIIYSDITLYACFEKQDIDTVLPEYTEISIDSEDSNYEIRIKTQKEIDERNLVDYIGINTLYGSIPTFRVFQQDDYYVISPSGGYQIGGVYIFELLSDDITFVDLNIEYENDSMTDEQVRTINLSIIGKEVSKVDYKTGIINIEYDDITSITETTLVISESIFKLGQFDVDTIIHVISDDEAKDFYVKVESLTKTNDEYVLNYVDCDVDEVYEDFNFNASDIIAVNERTLDKNQNETDKLLKEVVNSLYESEGTKNITQMLANALNSSPSVNQYTSSRTRKSSSYSDRITDKAGINISVEGLLDGLKITATLGSAKNPNFNGISIPAFNEDSWTMLQLVFEYEGTLKNKVKLEASITITEYLYVWFSFNADSKTGNFKVEATPYSQTDIEFKVLICSTDGEEDQKDDKDKKEEKKDISIEISNLVNGEGDSSNIIKDVQDMLENKGDAIELCKAPLFQASYVFGGVVSLNFDLNFVIKVSFAAGVKIEASVLEATTIGIVGNYKTKKIESYRRAANGSDRYVFDFYAYGYLGVKAGIEGEFTISFTGLKKAFRAGVSVEIGAYADLYGYLHYHAEERRVFKDVDTNGRHFQTLEGGIYFEMGIYLELKAFIGIGKKEYGVSKEFKFKLLEAGDKYLYVEAADNENLKLIFNENEEGTLDLDGIIPVEGKFLNIVTGEIVTKTLPTKSIRIVSLSNIYKSDNENHQILINKEQLDKRTDNIPSGKIALYYKGPNILFSSKSLGENIEELKGFKQLAEITVYYLKNGIEISEEQIGKEVTVSYQVEGEGKTTVVKTVKLIAGQNIDGVIPNELLEYCMENGLIWDISNNNSGCTYDGPTSGKIMITEDKTYTFKTHKALRFIGIQYMSNYNNNEWTMEIYAMSFNDVPTLLEKHLSVPENIYVSYNVINLDGSKYPMGSNEMLYKYDVNRKGTYGYETGVVLKSYVGTKEEIDNEYNKMRNNDGVFAEYNEYFTYTLCSEYQKSLLTVIFYDDFGQYSKDYVVFESTYSVPQYWINNINNTAGLRLIGWDIDGDGNVDLLPNQEFVVKTNMVLKPVMAGEAYTITITDENEVTSMYSYNYGDKLPKEILDIINNVPEQPTAPYEDSFYENNYWQICTSDFVVGDNNTIYFKGLTHKYAGDISVMPACDLTFKVIKGDLYHYVTFTDTTGGFFKVKNDDGSYSELTTIKFPVKDNTSVLDSLYYSQLTYVKPEDTETTKYLFSQYLDEDNNALDTGNNYIVAPKTYHISWWRVLKNSYTIKFQVTIYDRLGNIERTEIKYNYSNLTKDQYDELVSKLDEEYNYLKSNEYLEGLTIDSDYEYANYFNGELDFRISDTSEYTGVVSMYYSVNIVKKLKKFTVTINWNSDPNYYEQYETREAYINGIFTCEHDDYSFVYIDPETGASSIHYFLGYDSDNDGIIDYYANEVIIVRSDMNLVAVWTE